MSHSVSDKVTYRAVLGTAKQKVKSENYPPPECHTVSDMSLDSQSGIELRMIDRFMMILTRPRLESCIVIQ